MYLRMSCKSYKWIGLAVLKKFLTPILKTAFREIRV